MLVGYYHSPLGKHANFLSCQKSVETTVIGKSWMEWLIGVWYFLSFLRFLDLKSDIEIR